MDGAPPEAGLARLRTTCLGFPEAVERVSHDHPTWFSGAGRGGRVFCSHHDTRDWDGRISLWCPAPPGEQEGRVGAEPQRFFRPPYVGQRGWLGLYLDVPVDWDEVADLVEQAYRLVAPRRLVALL